MNSGKFRLPALLLVIVLLVSLFAMPVSADEVTDAPQTGATTGTSSAAEYMAYLEQIASYNYAKEDIVIDPLKYIEATDYEYEGKDGAVSVLTEQTFEVLLSAVTQEKKSVNCLAWRDNAKFQQQGAVTYEITVPEDGIYNLSFTYLPLTKTGGDADETNDKTSTGAAELAVKIDGKILYAGLDALSLPRMFVNAGSTAANPTGEIRVDTIGNQLTPEQEEYGQFVTQYAVDPVGVVAEPYKILLTAGTHKITVESVFEPIALANIVLEAPAKTLTYEEYAAKNTGKADYTGAAIEIEGENAWLKSTNSLVSKADNSSPDVTPNSPVKSKLNYIGNTNWQVPGETLSWIVEVPADGIYNIGMNYKQDVIIDGFTYRSISIDGEIPFEECSNLRFDYCTDWTFKKLGDKKPYGFYLTAGKHVITMTVTLGETSEFYSRLSDIVDKIGDMYMDIIMITSDSPDPNRDYELFRQIPNFEEALLGIHTDLVKLSSDMKALSGDRSSKYISALNNMARVVNEMYENKYTAQNYVSDFYSNYTTTCSWLYEMKTMPLNLDQIQLASPTKGFKDNRASFFRSLGFGTKRFFASFTDDFTSIGGSVSADAKGSVRIWVNWGRDQTQVLSNLIQDSFTAETGIGVQLEIVNASLVNGLLAGNFPDMSLHLSRTDPVNLGMRGALYDLTNFSNKKDPKYLLSSEGVTYTDEDGKEYVSYLLDYESVLTRFQPTASEPYWYSDGTGGDMKLFALPDTQGFFIMYYRTDVFERLGIDAPETANNGQGWTWNEFLDAATILQRNNMAAYVPYTKIASTTTVNAGMGSLNLFPTMLAQNKVKLYNEARNKTMLTSSEAIQAFTQWTDLYTKYGIEKQIDFYNRFRVGSAPLGIASYTTYTQLTQAAPEIQGRWKITAIPGILQEDGSVYRPIAGSGTGCSVVKRSPNKDLAWQFLCWWTSADTQLRYNNNVESILGAVSRTATANVEAFSSYSWNADDLEILLEQWGHVEELPELPGGYYVSRAVDQAYWAVLNGNDNEKDAMLEWGKVSDNEIARKIAEYAKK
ncbi:MAG: extracellular solute-binding protein [Clostridia bacterium]|nr:extracellular solute-binding protein [Clostridia bacterium]